MAHTTSRSLMVVCRMFFCFSLMLAGAGGAQTFFTEVTEGSGLKVMSSRGLAFGDYNNDGWPDFFITVAGIGRDGLFQNLGDGTFSDRTSAILGGIPDGSKGGGAIFGDYDNDGDLDLYIPFGHYFGISPGVNMFLRNDRGLFANVTPEIGLHDELDTDNAIWLDYDLDGYLDLYTGNLGKPDKAVNRLYRNNGNGTFADVTAETGLDVQLQPNTGGSNGGAAAGDFNDDGWPDLLVGVFQAPNHLFLNDGKGGFVDAISSEIADPGEAFGLTVGDIDNDGDLDFFQASGVFGMERSSMYLNLGDGQFLDVTEGVGLSALTVEGFLGARLGDIDNDGDLDLIIASPHMFFLNNGDGTFVDQTSRSGLSPQAFGLLLCLGDYNLDGFLDVMDKQRHLYRNNTNDNHWLRVELVGLESNRDGIGTRLIAVSEELQQMREIRGGLGFFQDEMVAHFGLGERTRVDKLEIRWPSGQVDVLTDIPADQKIRVFEGREDYHVVRPYRRQPPDSLVAGNSIELQTPLTPALPVPADEIISATADLSGLGGPSSVPLTDLGDGTFMLATDHIARINGLMDVPVVFETRSLGSYWTMLTDRLAVFPAEDLRVLDEELAAGWQVEGMGGVQAIDLDQGQTVYHGSSAGAFQVKPEKITAPWEMVLQPGAPIDSFGFTALRFAFHPGDSRFGIIKMLDIRINDGASFQLTKEGQVDLEMQDWQVVEIPLSTLGMGREIRSINLKGTLEGTFYLDDIRLVAATPPPSTTAVIEDHATSLPQSFTLSQNYPNPFNSDTVIRFALPESEEVELSVFNLAGQQVATVVEGVREGGTYTVRWDGRDDGGRELASGVYLYRLRTGQRLETRKLVLVK